MPIFFVLILQSCSAESKGNCSKDKGRIIVRKAEGEMLIPIS